MGENFKEKLAEVEALIFDVDGVFTEGGITLEPGGDFLRTYYAKDGYAVTYASSQGVPIFIISGGRGELLKRRFEMLKVTKTYTNIGDKPAALAEIVKQYGINLENTVYMGDDIPDLPIMQMVGIPVCPADACPEIIEASIYVSQYAGGKGCVRDIIEQVLRAQDKWLLHTIGMHTI
jgi:3-deoxy-D-manno-octulosonate 8-phosphate phosphatase (KDO 8-P phosphatase)